MNILSFDTSTESLSVCITTEESSYEYNVKEGLKHSEKLMPVIDFLMNESKLKIEDIGLIVCSKGPGSFTGLRIGMATAKGLALGSGCPLISIPSLDLYSYGFDYFEGHVFPIIDARKKCYYSADYYKGERVSDYLDISPENLKDKISKLPSVLLTGPHAELFYEDVKDLKNVHLDKKVNESNAFNLGRYGLNLYHKDGPDNISQGPLYLRKSEAELSLQTK